MGNGGFNIMEISCGTVVFREFELERALEAIRKIGYEYFETQGVGPWCQHVDVRKTDPLKFAHLAKSYGFRGVNALWMPDGNIISNERSVESAVLSLKWADAAGVPVVNTGDGFKPTGLTDKEALEIMKRRLDCIFESTAGCTAVLAIEPHGTFSLTLDGLRKILALAPAGRLGINYDAANIRRSCYVESDASGSGWKEGGSGENEANVLRGIVGRVVNMHAKDLDENRSCVALGEGIVKNAECVEILRGAGYAGVIALETEGGLPLDDSIALARRSYEYLKNLTGK